MPTEVKLNSAGIQELLDGGQGVREDLIGRANRVLAAAQADPHDSSGEYQDSLKITEDHTDRLAVRIGSDVAYAMVQEARYGVLARALDAAGGA